MSSRQLVAVVALAVAVAVAAPAAVSASVRTQRAPFALAVGLGATGELRVAGAPAAKLGSRTLAITRVVSLRTRRGRVVAELAAAAPSRVRARLTAGPTRAGVTPLRVAVRGPGVTAAGLSFAARPGERFLGFGERSDAVARTSGEVESFVSDGPWAPEDRSLVGAFVPPAGFRTRDDATYFPVPWLLSSRGHGVLALGDETHRHRLGERRWSVEADGRVLDLRVVAGPRPADALRRFTALTGRQPRVADQAILGPWLQAFGDEAQALRTIADAEAGAPLSLLQTYTHYLPCGDEREDRARERTRTARAHAAGVSITTYVNPMVCTGYTEAYDAAAAAGALGRAPAAAGGGPYRYRYVGSTQFEVSQYDFTAPAGDRAFQDVLGRAVADGHDGWMEDFGEYTPPDLVSADGRPGRRAHNAYPVLYHRAAQRLADRRSTPPLVRFVRSGWTGAARYAPVVWGGDPTVDWGFDGLRSAVRQGLSIGLSGVGLWGSDVGGFFALGERRLTRELLERWIELGALSGVMRTQANGFGRPRGERPQPLDPETLPLWREMARLRTLLWPYLAAARDQYQRTGLPLMRHHALTHPGDRGLTALDDQYMLGDDLLVAPVLEPGATSRRLRLPAGTWVDVWRSGGIAPQAAAAVARRGPRAAGGGAPAGRVVRGPRTVTLEAPRGQPPLLARAGALLSLLPSDVVSLSRHADRPGGPVGRAEREHVRRLLAFPRGGSSAPLGPDGTGTARSREDAAGWTLELRSRTVRRVTVEARLGSLRRPFRPCGIRGATSASRSAGGLRATLVFRRGRATLRALRTC